MAELADAPDLGSGVERRRGSSPLPRTHFVRARNGHRGSSLASRGPQRQVPFLPFTSVAPRTGIGVRHSLREGRNGKSPSSLSLRSHQERASGFVTRFASAATASPLPPLSLRSRQERASGFVTRFASAATASPHPRTHFGPTKNGLRGSSLASRGPQRRVTFLPFTSVAPRTGPRGSSLASRVPATASPLPPFHFVRTKNGPRGSSLASPVSQRQLLFLPFTSFPPRTGIGVRHSLREGRNSKSPSSHLVRTRNGLRGSHSLRECRNGNSSSSLSPRFAARSAGSFVAAVSKKKRLHLTRREAVRSGHASPRFSRRTYLQGR
jgi:hypothetical protein